MSANVKFWKGTLNQFDTKAAQSAVDPGTLYFVNGGTTEKGTKQGIYLGDKLVSVLGDGLETNVSQIIKDIEGINAKFAGISQATIKEYVEAVQATNTAKFVEVDASITGLKAADASINAEILALKTADASINEKIGEGFSGSKTVASEIQRIDSLIGGEGGTSVTDRLNGLDASVSEIERFTGATTGTTLTEKLKATQTAAEATAQGKLNASLGAPEAGYGTVYAEIKKLHTEDASLAGLIQGNSNAIAAEVTARTNADNEIKDLIGAKGDAGTVNTVYGEIKRVEGDLTASIGAVNTDLSGFKTTVASTYKTVASYNTEIGNAVLPNGAANVKDGIVKVDTRLTNEASRLEGIINSQTDALKALQFQGELTNANKGDLDTGKKGFTWVVGSDVKTILTHTLEQGDLIIVLKDNPSAPADITVVQKNIDGAVTAVNPLTEGKIVVGSNAQGVKVYAQSVDEVKTELIADASSKLGAYHDASVAPKFVELDSSISGVKVSIGSADDVASESGSIYARIAKNKADVTALGVRMTSAEGKVSTLEGDMTTAKGNITDLQGKVGDSTKGLVKDVADNKTAIAGVSDRVGAVEGLLTWEDGGVA